MNEMTPHDLNVEKALLSTIIQSRAIFDAVSEYVTGEDFFLEKHKIIFNAIYDLHRDNLNYDPVTVSAYLSTHNQLEIVGGLAYLLEVASEEPSDAHAEHYALIVQNKSILRKLLKATEEIQKEVYNGVYEPKEILDTSESLIMDIAKFKKSNTLTHIKELIHKEFDKIDTDDTKKDNIVKGLPTFKALDNFLNGLQKSDLIICAARPGMGKTSFCLNIAENAAIRHNKKVAVFSLEMSKEQLAMRMLSSVAMVDASKLKVGVVNETEYDQLLDGANKLSDAPVYIDDTAGINMMEIRGKLRRMQNEVGLDLVVIDYIQLMESPGSNKKHDNRQQEISNISRQLKLLARELNVPVIALSQLSRAVEQTADKIPNLSHLRESGSLEQDADIVLFIFRASYYAQDEEDGEDMIEDKTADIIIAKHRHGSTGKAKLIFLNEFTKFADMAEEH